MLEGGTDPVVIGINARIADGHDPSWLWDVAFERLAGRPVVATGERCRDLAVRLRHAGVGPRHRARRARGPGRRGRRRGWSTSATTPPSSRCGPLAVRRDGAATRPPAGRRVRAAPAERGPRSRRAAPGMPVAVTVAGPGTPATGRSRSSGPSALRVVVVHPDLLGTYGDGGNGRVLAGRAVWRDIPVELVHAPSDAPLPAGADIYCLGGGEDGPQVQSAERLRDGVLAGAVDAGAVVLAVCAGYQVIGRSFPGADGRPHPGVGLLDVVTVKGTGRRAVGELAGRALRRRATTARRTPWRSARSPASRTTPPSPVSGHGARPLARVLSGVGNGGGDGTEGARAGRVLGTYAHGPALARNPSLADLLLAWATGTVPVPLDDVEERALRAQRLEAVRARGTGDSGRPQGAAERLRARRRCADRVSGSRRRQSSASAQRASSSSVAVVGIGTERPGPAPRRRVGPARRRRLPCAGAAQRRPPVAAGLVGQHGEDGVDARFERAGVSPSVATMGEPKVMRVGLRRRRLPPRGQIR